MQIQEDFATIKTSETFRDLVDQTYLVSCFLEDEENQKRWDYNFYNSLEKEVFSFSLENNLVVLKGKSPLANTQTVPEELRIENLQSDQEEIFVLMKRTFLKEYTQDKILKIFAILEQKGEIFWSFLILLKNLQVVHMKISDRTYEIVENTSVSMIKKEKK